MAAVLLAFSFLNFLKGLMMFLFIVSAILLIVIVLLQEPKGGGLASAFGGAGGEAFGVQSGGVNKFTSVVAALFMLLAILYAAIRPEQERSLLESGPDTVDQAPLLPGGDPGDAGETPAPPDDAAPPPEDTAGPGEDAG